MDLSYIYNASYTEVQQRYYQLDGTLFNTRIVRSDVTSENVLGDYLGSTAQQVTQNQLNSLDELQKQTRFGQFGVNTSSVSTFAYDTEGRLALVQNVDGNANYVYNKLGQLTQITDTNNAITQYTNTAWGELTQLSSPDTGVTQYQINTSGEVSSNTNANNQQTIYSYDGLNRVTQIDSEGTALDVQLNYDENTNGKGHLTSVVDGSGSTQIQYNNRGLATQISSNIVGINLTTGYIYNDADDVTDITYPSGIRVKYNYDTAGRIAGVQLISSGITSDIIKAITWKGNQFLSYQHGNNLQTDYLYDNAGRLVEKQYGSLNNRLQNQLDNQGKIITQNWTRAGLQTTNSFEYDRMSRLTKENQGSLNLDIAYGYDTVGNRKTKQEVISGGSTTYQYDLNSSRLNSIDASTVQRDNAGNTLADETRTYQYNVLNRLSQTNHILSGMQGNYTYNFLGQRVRKQTSGTQITDIRYVYDSENSNRLIGEYDASGNRIREYLYINNGEDIQLVAQIESDGTVHYIHTDHLDSPRLISRQDQTLVWRWDSDAFGSNLPNEDLDGDGSNVVLNIRFPGQYYDSESGLHYNYFRDYDPSTGRYVQSDPIGLEGGLNTYGYVGGNPLRYFDPYGLAYSPQGEHGMSRFEAGIANGDGHGSVSGFGSGSFHLLLVGFSTNIDVVTDGEKSCASFTVCYKVGPGASIGSGFGSSISASEEPLASGEYFTNGVFTEGGGFGVFGNGSFDFGDKSTSGGKGFFGPGHGFAFGYQRCKVVIKCPNENQCPK